MRLPSIRVLLNTEISIRGVAPRIYSHRIHRQEGVVVGCCTIMLLRLHTNKKMFNEFASLHGVRMGARGGICVWEGWFFLQNI